MVSFNCFSTHEILYFVFTHLPKTLYVAHMGLFSISYNLMQYLYTLFSSNTYLLTWSAIMRPMAIGRHIMRIQGLEWMASRRTGVYAKVAATTVVTISCTDNSPYTLRRNPGNWWSNTIPSQYQYHLGKHFFFKLLIQYI